MKKGFIFRFARVVIVLAAATAIAVLLWTMRPKAERKVQVKTGSLVEVFPAMSENMHMIIEGYGTVKPREVLKLVTEVRGQITDIHTSFKEGFFAAKGTQLIKIDPRAYKLEVDRRKAQINQTRAEMKRLKQEVENIKASITISKSDVALAKAEFLRLKKLSGRKVVARTTLDQAEQRYLARLDRLQGLENQLALTGPLKEQFGAQLNMAKVLLHQAELDLEKTSITLPFNGWILEKRIEKGQHVHAGEYLGSAYSDGGLDIEVRIPVKDLKWFLPDVTRESRPEAEIVFSGSDSLYTWKGRVARVKAQMDERTRTLPVIVETDGNTKTDKIRSAFQLRPGMFVTVKIKGKEIKKAFKVPRHVVHGDGTVYLVSDNSLRFRSVSIVRRFKDAVIIEGGLSDGDLIVKTPLSDASEGMLIRLRESP